jgi:SAM-dependent methyltransferase
MRLPRASWAARAAQPLAHAAGRLIAKALDKPTVLLLADTRGWTFDNHYRQLAPRLADEFNVEIGYVREAPRLRPDRYDAVLVCFWGETYLHRFGFDHARVVKLVSSHRWEDDPRYGPCTPAEMAERHLRDCRTIGCTSARLFELMRPVFPRVFHVRTGYEPALFFRREERSGPMVVGWAGNAKDVVKGYHDIVVPACAGRFDLRTADGGLSHEAMNDFYNQLDVLLVASRHEGEPATLIESMGVGCFPVCTDVGIVPEVVTHKVNGYVLPERSADALRSALAWCEANLEHVRRMGRQNAGDALYLRPWDACAEDVRNTLHDTIHWVSAPRLHNDEVSWDSSLGHLPRRLGRLARPTLEQWRRFRDRFAHRSAEIDLPREAVVAAVERHKVDPWFVHAFDARQDRWDIRIPARFIADGWPRNARIFEVGCSCALNLIWLGQQGFVDLHGSDLAPGHIAAGQELAARAGVPIQLWQDNGLEPERLPESCDVLIALSWMHIVPGFELRRFLSIYRAALKPGGCLIIDVIDRAYDQVPDDRYHSADHTKPLGQRRPSEHVARFSSEEVAAIAAEQGLPVLHRFSREQSVPKQVYVLRRPRQ